MVLYLFLCRGCAGLFLVCRSCYRGHAYCGEECKLRGGRASHGRANQRLQDSLEGKLDHADRQRAYRARKQQLKGTTETPGQETAAGLVEGLRADDEETRAVPLEVPVAGLAVSPDPVGPKKVTDHSRPALPAFHTLPESQSCSPPRGDGAAQAPCGPAREAPEKPPPRRRSSGRLVCRFCGRSGPVVDCRKRGRLDRSRVRGPHSASVLR